jgi:putative pyruvate formate lyase activating enzyme
MPFVPSYIALHRSGELRARAEALHAMLASCNICPHDCGNNRLRGEIARCYTAEMPVVSAYTPHFGEEPALVGTHGVGNIFFGNCNLRCVYCQNYLISQNHRVQRKNEVTFGRLAQMMIELQEKGCHWIGLVSPTHVVPQVVQALDIAAGEGLRVPLIYNTNAYDSVDVLRLLDGVIDIYLPDLKYADDEMGREFSKVDDYAVHARRAVSEMHRQVGSQVVTGDDGLLKRGLIIRHLVLPNDIASSRETLTWVRDTLGPDTTLSIMSQYFPAHRALTIGLLDRKLRQGEYNRVLVLLDELGIENGWVQEFEASDYYRPEFDDRARPFKGMPDNSIEVEQPEGGGDDERRTPEED